MTVMKLNSPMNIIVDKYTDRFYFMIWFSNSENHKRKTILMQSSVYLMIYIENNANNKTLEKEDDINAILSAFDDL